MNVPQELARGRYSASLLGTIRSNLEGLQGYDVMALELIQNADDAGAEEAEEIEIRFDVTDSGLRVWNSGTFSYCGSLQSPQCPMLESTGYGCDFHRITEVASGGKLRRADNIGRFGIGFVSTYQITDHPEISSNGINLKLYPERAEWDLQAISPTPGTSFFLPWATDPSSEVRRKLGLSAIERSHVNKLVEDFKGVLGGSLLFLRHARKAQLLRHGELVYSCTLERPDETELVLTVEPTGDVERWYILRSDASEEASSLTTLHPPLKEYDRATQIGMGIRIAPSPLTIGCLYAFLPTAQSSGLPLHLNADFFPEPDRKAIIFSGHQHQQAWNEMLVRNAARQLAQDLVVLNSRLEESHFWRILSDAFDIAGAKRSEHPECFSSFWQEIKTVGTSSSIVRSHEGIRYKPSQVLFVETPLTEAQTVALERLGAHLVSGDLRPYRNVLLELDTSLLTLERLTDLLESSSSEFLSNYSDEPHEIDNFLVPLWEVIESLLPVSAAKGSRQSPTLERLKKLPFILAHNLNSVAPQDCFLVPKSLGSETVSSSLPFMSVASQRLSEYPRLASLVTPLTVGQVATILSLQVKESSAEVIVGTEPSRLKELYTLLANLDSLGTGDQTAYNVLKELSIWLTGTGLAPATKVFLPGDFKDPTGQSELMDLSALTSISREFIEKKLQVKTQTIDAYVRSFLPRFFSASGPSDPTKFPSLILELSRHNQLIDSPSLRAVLAALPLVPTMDGKWGSPQSVYYRSDRLVELLGDDEKLWVDESRLPAGISARSFLQNLGIRRSPSPTHLVDRMVAIARNSAPTEVARKSSAAAFYELCDYYDKSKENVEIRSAITHLGALQCFPAEGDMQSWHLARALYAPYRSEGFRSQAKILDFRDMQRLKSEVLGLLNVTTEPETKLVVAHFLWCIQHKIEPHYYTYQILSERSAKADQAVLELRNHPCIYVGNLHGFVRPNRVFWTTQQLDRFAYVLPSTLESFRPFFRVVGVKDGPDSADFADIILEILNEYFPKQAAIIGKDLAVYEVCLRGIAASLDVDSLDQQILQRLREAPTVLNLANRACHPDEVLYKDSEWLAGMFDAALDEALCAPPAEVLPLLQLLGVKPLSDCCSVSLEFVAGEELSETDFAVKLNERATIIARLLHDQPTIRREAILQAISNLSTFSYDLIRIQAALNLGGSTALSTAKKVPAFYDSAKNSLILARPLNERSWPHIFNALFHQLLPNESGTEISKLALILDPLMSLSAADGDQRLTDAGIPAFIESRNEEDLTSAEVHDFGSGTNAGLYEENSVEQSFSEGDASSTSVQDSAVQATSSEQDSSTPPIASPACNDAPGHFTSGATHGDGDGDSPGADKTGSFAGAAPSRGRRSRPQYKEEWDRRLLSYVHRTSHTEKDEHSAERTEHNLAVEAAARDAVCDYEKARGRVPDKLPQAHPGYDIISVDPNTGKERRIEVKGRSGSWNQLGVGLTRTEFSNAQDFGDDYWLYVVEFAFDRKARRIYPIENPVFKVDSFMFDGKWRDAATEEEADPCYAFQPGVRISHEMFGIGVIEKLELRGATRMLRVQFERGGERIVPINLAVMTVLEDPSGEDNS